MTARETWKTVRQQLVCYAEHHHIAESRLFRRFDIVTLIKHRVPVRCCAWYLDCSEVTIRRWTQRIEEVDNLFDRSRPGRPPLFTEQIRLKLIGFYCQNPVPGCRMSFSWAEKYLNEHQEFLGRKISDTSIQRIIRSHGMRPHLIQYFLQITDPDFFPKMEHIISLYMNRPDYLFCWDECTGLQALERVAAELKTDNGTRIEFEYKRHGTVELCGILNCKTGHLFGKCIDNHCTDTLAAILEEHVNRQPKNTPKLHYICDNLAGHSTEIFCQKVAELSDIDYPKGLNTKERRRQWLQSEEKRIVFHFVPYHGSWLNLIEIWFGILQSKSLRGQSFKNRDELITTINEFIETWNEHFAHPFNWVYRGTGLIEKVVCRFCTWLESESSTMNRKFLNKQFQLLYNVIQGYRHQVRRKHRHRLDQLLREKKEYITAIIGEDSSVTVQYNRLCKATTESLAA